jgi:nitrate/nitrite transporter NarK
VAFGIGFAAADTMTVRVMPEVFGMRALGAIMGVITLGWRLGAALGPTAAGSLYDVTGSYTLAFGAAPAGVALSWVFFALATARRPG